MKKRREYVAVLAFLAAIIGISGCSRQKEEKLTKYDTQFFELFDTVTSVTGYVRDEKTFQSYVDVFYDELMKAEVVKPKDFEEKFFEGCMPFEEMARRGKQTLLFGPMKPVGLTKPDGTKPYAVVQLRQDNVQASLYNIVGFQTHLTWPEQRRIIHLIPGLENATFVRYGVMHRNSFICSPKFLNQDYSLKNHSGIYFAGQMTGVEGYVESAQSGIVAGMNMVRYLNKQKPVIFPQETIMGALAYYAL